ncbi:MAG: IS110 family transposase [Candidatus Electronema sp. VV]
MPRRLTPAWRRPESVEAFLAEKGHAVRVVCPVLIKAFDSAALSRTKTDKKEARLIAALLRGVEAAALGASCACSCGTPRRCHPPPRRAGVHEDVGDEQAPCRPR